MELRPQQKKLLELVKNIAAGNLKINRIFLFWAPGGGKSLAPVILSDLLTNNRKQIWVVPRNALKYQGEKDYQNDIYPVNKVARVADNSGDPFRGCDSCLTTYQAIGANPEKWIQICEDYNVMLILDEFHHLSGHGDWIKNIEQMAALSFLNVLMTGTIFRGDNTKIPFIPYIGSEIDFSDNDKIKWIIYGQKQAMQDGSILSFDTMLINGSGEYIDKEGFTRTFDKFGESGDHLRCAFKTDYAYHLLDLTINHWRQYKSKHHFAKLLIVSPDIATAKIYLEYVKNVPNIFADIATSEDSKECKHNIDRFKKPNINYRAINCLITVAVAYEGLSVPEVTHMAIMTLIRSEPWLAQCTARCVRNFPGKQRGYIFAPQDPRMLRVLQDITEGRILNADGEPPEPSSKADGENTSPESEWNNDIQALSSEAHIDGISLFSSIPQDKKQNESQSEKETRLRKDINSVINNIVGAESAGNRKVKERIFWLRVKQIVNNGRDNTGKIIKKALKEMTVPELEKVEEFTRNYK